MPKKYVVTLTEDQESYLLDLLKKGKAKARKLTRARNSAAIGRG